LASSNPENHVSEGEEKEKWKSKEKERMSRENKKAIDALLDSFCWLLWRCL